MSEPRTRPDKKPYCPPELRKIKLQPQGAVLGICKNNPGPTGPGGENCNAAISPCSEWSGS
jgi:hypothetical protein